MRIHFSPVFVDGWLSLARHGDTLVIDGEAFDFGQLAEGHVLPRAAVSCAMVASDVTRQDGQIVLTLILPHGSDAAEAIRFPAPVDLVEDGPVDAPGLTPPNEATTIGDIDWQQSYNPGAPVIPAEVSRFQARAALHIAGLLPSIEAALAAADPLAQIAWADAQVFRRDSPTIAALAAAIGMTEAQIDALFIQAAQIQA